MNFLQLVQKAIRKSGARASVPSSLSSVEGIQLEFKEYVNDAWKEIQMERKDWYFRAAEQSIDIDQLSLTDGMRVPTSLIDAANSRSWNFIHIYDVYIRLRGDDTDPPSRIYFVPWNNWKDKFGRSNIQLEYNDEKNVEGRPQWFTIAPTGELWLSPIPTASTNYEMEFFGPTDIQDLSNDSDTPVLPERYHDMIVWKAAYEFHSYHTDAAGMERARQKYMMYKKLLDEEYLTQITLDPTALYRSC